MWTPKVDVIYGARVKFYGLIRGIERGNSFVRNCAISDIYVIRASTVMCEWCLKKCSAERDGMKELPVRIIREWTEKCNGY